MTYEQGFALGLVAHQEGRPSAPFCDPVLVAGLAGMTGTRERLDLLRGFAEGWHSANALQPVEEVAV